MEAKDVLQITTLLLTRCNNIRREQNNKQNQQDDDHHRCRFGRRAHTVKLLLQENRTIRQNI